MTDLGIVSSALSRVERVAAVTVGERRLAEEAVPRKSPPVAWPGQPTKLHAEAYAKLADAILERLLSGELASLMFVSPTDGGGTTGMLAPLAAALAQRVVDGVIVVDANLHHPALARSLGIEATRGLAEILQGSATWAEVLRSTAIERLRVVPSGRPLGRGGGEVDLGLFARRCFQPPKRERATLPEAPHKLPHAVVADCEVLFGDQILMDPLGRKPQVEFRQEQLTVRLAGTL